MKPSANSEVVVTLIGDVVSSRTAVDRRDLHRALASAIAPPDRPNQPGQTGRPDQPEWNLRITVGDEFQGTFTHLGQAIEASISVRLALLPDHDVRFGIGRGAISVLAESPRVEDGPGWWSARAAIEAVKQAAGQRSLSAARTCYRPAEESTTEPPAVTMMVNAALLGVDQLIGAMDARGLSVLRGLLAQQTQREIAQHLDITPSAVSQRVSSDAIGVVLAMLELLREVP